jgi:hypothetical protein
MRKLMTLVALMGLVAAIGCNATDDDATNDDATTVPSVTGTWAMVANTAFEFNLTLTQSGGTIGGFMERTNGIEPIDPVNGTINAGGVITFTRGRVSQTYTGIRISDATSWILEGTFVGVGDTNTVPWRATMPK